MTSSRTFLCGGATLPAKWSGCSKAPVEFSTEGNNSNITLKIEDVSSKVCANLQPRLLDLLEIASYVFSGDCASIRERVWNDAAKSEPWDRGLRFALRVRDLPFWKKPEVSRLLCEMLKFISDTDYTFVFQKKKIGKKVEEYFGYGTGNLEPFSNIDRIVLFSGGLDSLAGAVETLSKNKDDKIVLVSHRSVSLKDTLQKKLADDLAKKFPSRVLHVPVWLNKDEKFGREHTQRTRSFLFASLAATVAALLNSNGIRFFENGVVSLNLPVADEVLRARASRTTHPQTLKYFEEFFSLVLDRPIVVDNPFLFHTKAEVIKKLSDCNSAELIGKSVSCAHTGFKSKDQQHCGRCSQCIDRRVAVLEAGASAFDSETDYETNVFTGKREDALDLNMAVDFARHVTELSAMSDTQIASRFNQHLSRAARPFSDRSKIATDWIGMLRRYAQYATKILTDQVSANSRAALNGTLDSKSLIGVILGKEHLTPNWRRLSSRITQILKDGLPPICKTHPAKDEPHLQQMCEGLLNSSSEKLRREFPYLPWSVKLTKPDFYSDEFSLLVELKYVREKKDVAKILSDIAEDITKYGDNNYPVLFVVYDPSRQITNDNQFAEPVRKRENMHIEIVR